MKKNQLTAVSCSLCQTNGAPTLKTIDGWHIVRCPKCGFCYLNPRPAPADRVYEEVDEDRWRRRSAQDTPARTFFFRKQLDLIGGALKTKVEKPRRILDFGCGTGQFLDVALTKGWKTYGIEPDPLARINEERGHEIQIGVLPHRGLKSGFFDAVFSSAVFEHVGDPAAELRALAALLRPGGVLLITSVPNFGSLTIRLGVANFYAQAPPGDVNFFTPKTMRKMAEAAGLTVLQASSYGFDYNSFLKRRGQPMAEPAVRPIEKPKQKTRMPKAIVAAGVALYQQVGPFGLGSKIHLLARREN